MSDEVIIAIIGLIGIVLTAIVAQLVSASKDISERLRAIEKQAHGNSIKLETLWAIYAEDAIRDAKKDDMIAHKSTAVPTEKWYEITTDHIRSEIDNLIETIPRGTCPREMAIQVTNEIAEELLTISAENDVSAASLFGTIYMMCVTSRKWVDD